MTIVNDHQDELVADCPEAAATPPPLPDYLVEIGYITMEQMREGKIKLVEGRRGIMVVGGVWALQEGAQAAPGQNGR